MSLNGSILLLHYSYPPQHTTGGIRIHKINLHFQSYFTKVYTLSYPKKTTTYPNAIKSLGIFKIIIHLRYSFPTNLLFGKDHIFYFITTLIKGLRLIKKEKISYLFTSYQPLSDLLIGLVIKKLNPHIFWIADFRDPYPEEIKAKNIFPPFQQTVLQWIKKHCNLLTVVSEGLQKNFQPLDQKFFVLYNGMDKGPKKLKIPKLDSEFTGLITYTGSIYPQLINPQPFLSHLKILFPLARFLYLGKDAASWKKWLPKGTPRSIIHCLKSHAISKKIQKQSDILLLFSWSNHKAKGILTTKLFEYLKANKIVIVLIQGEIDLEWETIGELFLNCIIFYTHSFSFLQLQTKLLNISNSTVKFDYPKISKYLWTHNIAQLIATIKELPQNNNLP